jgi:hypothetical protein
VALITHSSFDFCQGQIPHPADTNFEAVDGNTQAGLPVEDFKINSNPDLQATSSGKMPAWICFSGDMELSPILPSSVIIGTILRILSSFSAGVPLPS